MLQPFDKKHEQKKKHKTQTKRGKDDKSTEETSLLNVAYLCKQDIQEEMIILGQVDTVKGDNMFVSLPYGNVGIVTSFDLGQSYLDGITQSMDSSHSLEFQPIQNLYNPGDYVVCYVKKNIESKKISLSLDPQLINQGVSSQFLTKGAKIVCTIMSVEENGYVIETGIANVKGFLANKSTDDGKCYCKYVISMMYVLYL